ncbi:MAG: ribosome-associated translation inhibitor RaiA [Magnetospirillum sp. WYHS-4]
MEITVKGKQMDVGEALRGHVEQQLNQAVTKYFDRAIDATVVFQKTGHQFLVDISVHPGRGLLVQGSGNAGDAHQAFDGAMERIGKQLKRYKQRLRDHHKGPADDEKVVLAQRYILKAEGEHEEVPAVAHPAIVAEMPTTVATMTVSEAVMRMDLADVAAMMFRNSAHGRLNVVYRRPDGNIGWIDPSESH